MRDGRLTAILVAALVLVLVGGGATAYLVGRGQSYAAATPGTPSGGPTMTGNSSQAPGPTVVTTSGDATTDPASSDPASEEPATDSPSTPRPVPTPPPTTKDAGPTETEPPSTSKTAEPSPTPTDDTEVAIAGVAADDPQAEEIRDLLQRHFDSINDRDYAGWAATVTSDLSVELSEKEWLEEYGTTRDTDINIITIRRDPREVNISFRSRQDKAHSPEGRFSCLNWQVKHPLTSTADGLRINRSVEGDAIYYACSGE